MSERPTRYKPRYFVTLHKANVDWVYQRHGPRSLSSTIDKLLAQYRKQVEASCTTPPKQG